MSTLRADNFTNKAGTGAPSFPNGLTVNKGSLGTTAGNTLTVSDFYHNNGNVSYLRIKATRTTGGTTWTTASTKLLQVIDVTEMGYIEFNPNGSNYGIALGQGGSEHMRLLSNGNVGIGLTNPSQKLDVFGNIKASGTTSPSLIITPTSGSSYIFGANTSISGGGIYDNTAGIWRLVVKDTTGNLGIGNTNPGSALDVKGTIRLSGSASGYIGLSPATNAGSTTYTLPNADGSSGQVLSTDGSGTLSWASPIRYVQGTAVNTTSGSTVQYTSLPSWVKRITFMFSALSSTSVGDFLFQLSTGGVFATSGYTSVVIYSGGSGAGSFTAGSTSTSGGVLNTNNLVGGSFSFPVTGTFTFTSIGSGNIWIGTIVVSSSTNFVASGTTRIALSGTLDGIRLLSPTSTTFNGGTVNISYEG